MGEDESRKKTMSVIEMGRLLGLKKVDSYWLVHKGYFDVITVNGKMRVVTDSFESWYTRQNRYHKVNGEPPGAQLAQESYSVPEVARMLGIHENYAYTMIAQTGMKTVLVNSWMRVPKEAFEEWYKNQDRYRLEEDREKEAELRESTMSMPDIARLLDVPRGTVYSIIRSKKGKQFFNTIQLAGQTRITKESFEDWYRQQSRYLKLEDRDTRYDRNRKHYRDCLSWRNKTLKNGKKIRVSANEDYLTIDEAALLAQKSHVTINRWIQNGSVPAERLGQRVTLIPREEFEAYLLKSKEHRTRAKKGGSGHGSDH